MAVAYLNVDLEIEGLRPLFHILQEFSESDICCRGCFETGRGHSSRSNIENRREASQLRSNMPGAD